MAIEYGELGLNEIADSLPEITVNLDPGEIVSSAIQGLPPETINKIDMFLTLGKWVLIAILIYIVFMIIKQFFKFRDSVNLSKLVKLNKNRNKKLDILVLQNEKRDLKSNKKEVKKKK